VYLTINTVNGAIPCRCEQIQCYSCKEVVLRVANQQEMRWIESVTQIAIYHTRTQYTIGNENLTTWWRRKQYSSLLQVVSNIHLIHVGLLRRPKFFFFFFLLCYKWSLGPCSKYTQDITHFFVIRERDELLLFIS
jgi:hypothetical protein